MPKNDKTDKTADPYADWSDEDRAAWDASAKHRERHNAELRSGLLEDLKGLLFSDPQGGGMEDPDGDDDTDPPPDAGPPDVPWYERTILGRRK